MKILFVIHNLDYADHIAIACLSAIAKQLNHLTYFCSMDKNDLNVFIEKIKPEVVAYSVNIMGFDEIVATHKNVKKSHNFVSIMGGPHPTYSPETFSASGMDAYCMGEGEHAFRDFLLNVEKGSPFDDVANLITKNKTNSVRALITNLDELPLLDRDLVLENSFLRDTPKKTFYATRGCPFRCAYCCNNYYHALYKGKGPAVRRFSVERIIQEIEDVRSKYRMDFIKFGDDLFAVSADSWLEEFSRKYSKRIRLPFNCYLRLDIISDELLTLLKSAGCFSVHLSLDSASEHVRENVLQRNMRKVDIIKNLRKIKDYGINTWVNYMLAAPDSTLRDDLETIRISRKARVTYPSYSTTVPMKGTRLYYYCLEHKYLNLDGHSSDMTGCWEKSTLLCFTESDKRARYNIYLLGALIVKLPFFLHPFAEFLIKKIPPNHFFKRIRDVFYKYYIENKIFLLPKHN